jgi:hypothetical protein
MELMAMRVTEMGASEGCLVTGQIEVASPRGDKITSPETELTSRWCSSSRPLEEPMYEAKQMTTGQPVGAASHTSGGFSTAVRIGSQSVSSRSYSFESGRVLVFQGGVIERSSRMRGNLQVRFLEGWASAMAPGHSTVILGRALPGGCTRCLSAKLQSFSHKNSAC